MRARVGSESLRDGLALGEQGGLVQGAGDEGFDGRAGILD